MASKEDFGPVFPAKYDGTCSICERPIREGELIQADERGAWDWAHKTCVNRTVR